MNVGMRSDYQWSIEELTEIAKWQKYIIWVILINIITTVILLTLAAVSGSAHNTAPATAIIGLFLWGFGIALAVFNIFCVYKLATAIHASLPILYALAMCLSIIGLIVLLVLNDRAINILKMNGIKVGLMGVDYSDIERIRIERYNSQ